MTKYLIVLSFILPLLSGCVTDSAKPAENAYSSDYERFFQNVIVKEKSPYRVTYEYKDVRLDEVAYLASQPTCMTVFSIVILPAGRLLIARSCKTDRLFLYKNIKNCAGEE